MARRLLAWAVALTGVMALYTLGLAHGKPEPAYTPSLAQRAWLNPSNVYHPDEFAYVGLPYRMLLRRDWNPHYFHNPSLTLNTNLTLFGLIRADRLPHNTAHGDREIAPFALYVSARTLSTLFALLTVPLTFAAGRVAFGREAAVIAAGLVALAPLSVQHAHYATPNALTTMLATASLLAGLALLRGGYPRRLPRWLLYGGAGLLVGLAASARYNAILVALVVGPGLLADWSRHRGWVPLFIAIASVAFGFTLGTPAILLAPREVLDQIRDILDWYAARGGGPGFTASRGAESYFYHLRYLVLMVVGPGAALAAAGGLVRALWRGTGEEGRAAALLAVYAVVYTMLTLAGSRLQANLLLPLIGPLALLAGYAIPRIVCRWPRQRWLLLGLGALLLAWPLALSLLFVYRVSALDNRLEAQAWLYQHVPRGTSVYLLGPYNVPVDPLDYEVTQTFGGEAGPEEVRASSAAILVYSDAYPHSALRATKLASLDDVARERAIQRVLAQEWIELAHFERWPWPGERLAPDDVSYWHQVGITIYCRPAVCPVGDPSTF